MPTDPKPLVTGGTHSLPFEKLTPDQLEELCLWLVERLGFVRVEHPGKAGSDRGRDVVAWKDGRSFVFQCKRVGAFSAAKGIAEIEKIRRELSSDEQPDELVFVVSRAVSDGVRKQIRRAWSNDATCHFWASTELNEKVSRFPEIVEQFFQVRLAPSQSPLHQLPAPPADFVGRTEDLAALRASAKNGGATICGLQGQGGIGKTALALVLAHEMAADFPDAQILLDLQGVSERPLSTADAMAHVVRSFLPEGKIPERAQLAGMYRDVLSRKRALLLMDNASGRDQVEPLLPPAGCALLVTSRQKFALPGLVVRDLELLPEKYASELLLAIAPRIGDRAHDIARLCGYLPFALRIAASTLVERPDLTVETYEKRLGGEKERAAIGEKVLGLSYSLLPDAFQERFRYLAVFAGDFDAQAARAVWGLGDDETDETLGTFVRGSLLEGKEGRYKLHDLARAFAASRLICEETAEAEQHHAEHYCGILRETDRLYQLGNDHLMAGLALFDRERHQITAGQAWAAKELKVSENAARLASEYQTAGVSVLGLRQPPRELIAWIEAGREGARRIQDRATEGRHLGSLGIAYAKLGETLRAIEIYHQALAIARDLGDRRSEGNALGCLGLAYSDLGEFRCAIEYQGSYLTISREIGAQRGEGNALGNLGNAHRNLGETQCAVELYEQQLIITHKIGDRRGEANACGGLGLAYADLGEIRRSIEYQERYLTIAHEIGDRRSEGNALGNLGIAYKNLGEIRRAIEYYEQQLTVTREIGDRRGEGIGSWNLGEAYEELGELAQAVELMQVRVDFLRELGHPDAEKDAARVKTLQARLETG